MPDDRPGVPRVLAVRLSDGEILDALGIRDEFSQCSFRARRSKLRQGAFRTMPAVNEGETTAETQVSATAVSVGHKMGES